MVDELYRGNGYDVSLDENGNEIEHVAPLVSLYEGDGNGVHDGSDSDNIGKIYLNVDVMRGYLTGEEKDLTSAVAIIVHEIIHINQISDKAERQEANKTNSSTKEERLAKATEDRVKDRIVLSDKKLSKEEFDAYQEELKEINDKKGRKQQTVEESTVEGVTNDVISLSKKNKKSYFLRSRRTATIYFR